MDLETHINVTGWKIESCLERSKYFNLENQKEQINTPPHPLGIE